MSNSRARNTRVFTVSFPESLAQQVEQVAKEESRNISELFREAFRAYKAYSLERRLEALRPESADEREMSMDEIQGLVDEVRTEMYRERIGKH